jgi:putative 4-mercaptohistidine N1-methyltranferase
MNPYETPRLLDQYLLFHYGSAADILPWPDGPVNALNFPVRTVTELVDWCRLGSGKLRALDLGCAVGRSSFELSKRCEEVIGIDFSSAFVETARRIAAGATVGYERLEEGRLTTKLEARLPEEARPERVRFETGDALNLPADMGRFDLLHAANLLCRLARPRDFLKRAAELLRPGGQLVLTTPATWLEEFTPRENWPEGEILPFLEAELGGTFKLCRTREMPFLIRETRRKYQWTVALGTVWERRAGGVSWPAAPAGDQNA